MSVSYQDQDDPLEVQSSITELKNKIHDMEKTFNATIAALRQQRDMANDQVVQHVVRISHLTDMNKEIDEECHKLLSSMIEKDDLIKKLKQEFELCLSVIKQVAEANSLYSSLRNGFPK